MEIFGYQLPTTILGFEIPRIAVVISLGVAFYYIAVFFMRVGMAGLGGMLSVGRNVAKSNNASPRPATASLGPAVAFNRAAVNAAGADWEEVQAVNTVLAQLQERKKAT